MSMFKLREYDWIEAGARHTPEKELQSRQATEPVSLGLERAWRLET